jgi:hypothetical protein
LLCAPFTRWKPSIAVGAPRYTDSIKSAANIVEWLAIAGRLLGLLEPVGAHDWVVRRWACSHADQSLDGVGIFVPCAVTFGAFYPLVEPEFLIPG